MKYLDYVEITEEGFFKGAKGYLIDEIGQGYKVALSHGNEKWFATNSVRLVEEPSTNSLVYRNDYGHEVEAPSSSPLSYSIPQDSSSQSFTVPVTYSNEIGNPTTSAGYYENLRWDAVNNRWYSI